MSNFIAKSISSKNALSSAMLAKNLPVNVLIIGERSSGKTSLAKVIVDSIEPLKANEIENSIDKISNQTVFIKEFDKINNIKQFIEVCNKNSIRVVATSINKINYPIIDSSFPVQIELEPIQNRVEDAQIISKDMIEEAKSTLIKDNEKLKDINIDVNLNQNIDQIRKSIYLNILFESINEDELLTFLEKYFDREIQKDKTYKELIKIYEIPLLRASKKRFKSQLKMATKLELNRITLRKKLDIYKDRV